MLESASQPSLTSGYEMNRRPLLVTSNGFGMGHLVRQLAVSKNFPEATILTLSGAAPMALTHGARLEYCPSYTTPWITKRSWHRGYLRDRIALLAREVQADVLVFDGVVPYAGLLNAIRDLNIPAVWMRRGLWRDSAKTWPLKYSSQFDLVIEPGDVGATHDRGPTRGLPSSPVGVITEAGKMLPRDKAADALGVDGSKPTLLVNVGSTSDVDFSQVAFPTDWNVIATSDALGRNRSQTRIAKVSGLFPLHPYLSAVDLAVTSVGYNAAHEFVANGVPTVLVPSDNATDDQYSRADAMVALGVSSRATTPLELSEQIKMWTSDSDIRLQAHQKAKSVAAQWTNGAEEASALISQVKRSKHHTSLRLASRNLAERLLQPTDRGAAVDVLFTHALEPEMMRGNVAIEHVLSGTSESYLGQRQEIARGWLEKGA